MYEASKYLQAINKTKKSFFQRGLRVRDYLHGRRARMAAIIVTLNRIQHVPFYVNRIDSSAAQEYDESFCGRSSSESDEAIWMGKTTVLRYMTDQVPMDLPYQDLITK
ncbi:hypothetical protein G5I_12299 [Acromyrmex echinatior]|uniref:Uncharacterized protein n=1 Tax=Acromyrmex echinatior TaxID=103372 RepID=F4X1Y0_ACREC|nr:hypothetical protein G5I_12299 [Acromyrmex echinatior]